MTDTALAHDLLAGEELAYHVEEPAREARRTSLPPELDPRVRDAVGVDGLYLHQRAAWEAAARGEHLVITTGTAQSFHVGYDGLLYNGISDDVSYEKVGYKARKDQQEAAIVLDQVFELDQWAEQHLGVGE